MNIAKILKLSFVLFITPYILGAEIYSVSLMWINSTYDENQNYISDKISEKELGENCLRPILDWAKKSPEETKIYYWYDSKYTNPTAIKNTEEYFIKNELNDKIYLKDVRILPYVINHEDVFSDQLPVYFRSDLLRVIATTYLADSKDTEFIIYSDLNVTPMSQEEIFDEETNKNLKKFGFVLTENIRDNLKKYENGFFILDSNNENIIQANKFGLIEINLKRAQTILEYGYQSNESKNSALKKAFFSQVVWSSYASMFRYYKYLEMMGDFDHNIIMDTKYTFNNSGFERYTPDIEGTRKVYLDTNVYPKEYAEIQWLSIIDNNPNTRHYLLLIQSSKPREENSLFMIDNREERKKRYTSENLEDIFSVETTSLKHKFMSWNNESIAIQNRFNTNFIHRIVVRESKFEDQTLPVKSIDKPSSKFYSAYKPKS